MCLLTETRALSAQGEKRALVGNLTMPFRRLKGCGDMPRLVSAHRARDQQLGLGVSEVNVA